MLRQVSVYAENKKGALKVITGILTEAQINILGSVTNDSAEYGIIRMVVTDPDKAQEILQKAGYLCRLTNVLGIEVEDEVGSLNRVLAAFLESNINVNYSICPLTASPASRSWCFTPMTVSSWRNVWQQRVFR